MLYFCLWLAEAFHALNFFYLGGSLDTYGAIPEPVLARISVSVSILVILFSFCSSTAIILMKSYVFGLLDLNKVFIDRSSNTKRE